MLERFVGQRLVTKDRAAAEITHEALLGAWPRLRMWIDGDREDIRIRHFIEVAAQAWVQAGREAAALLRGGQLALAADWMAGEAHRAALSEDARDFLDAGITEERAQQAAARRHTRRLRQQVAALTVLVLLTLGLAAYAFHQRHAAMIASDEAESRTVAVEAGQVRPEDPGLAAQLSLAAYRISPTRQALASLLESTGTPMAARIPDAVTLVQAVAVSPGRQLLAVAAADGTLRLWSLAKPGHPTLVGTVPDLSPSSPLYAAAFSPNGQVLAAAGAGRTVQLWQVSDPHHPVRFSLALTGPGNTVYSLAFSPDGGLLAAGSADKKVWLWDVRDPTRPRPLGGPLTGATGYVQAVAFSPDGRLLAAASADKTVRLWDVADPARPRLAGKPLTGPGGAVDSVAFSPDGKTLAAGSYDDNVWLWRITKPASPVPLPPLTGATSRIMAVTFSPGGQVLAAGGSDGQVRLWRTATRALLAVLPHPQPVTSVAWDGPGVLVSGDADGYARVWHLPAPDLLTGSPVNSIATSPAAGVLVAGGAGLQTWSLSTRQLTASAGLPGANIKVNSVAISPGGHLIATGDSEGRVELWRREGAGLTELGTPQVASRLPAGFTNQVEFVAFSPDGKVLASAGDDGKVRLWNVTGPAGLAPLAVIPDSRPAVFSVAFSPSGRTLAAASGDDKVRLWNVTDPAGPVQLGGALPGPTNTAYSVAFSPDGHLLAVGSADKDIRLWDVSELARPHRIGPLLTGPAGYVYSVAFGPGGHVLAAGNTDGSVWLWNLARPAHPVLITALAGPSGQVFSVGFGPGRRTLAAADSAGLVWFWDIQASTATRAVCATAGQPLTAAEWRAYVPGEHYAPPCR